jgi:zinc protease
MPQPGTAVEPATPAIQSFTLSNGLEVFVARKPGLPLVAARLSLPAGSAHDPSGRAGVANMTAALLTQGADGRSAPEIAAQIEQLGADIGASPGADFTTVYANAPADVFPQAMEIMADLALRPDFAVEELERQRDQALDGLRIQLSSPGPVGSATVARVIYGDAPYGAPGGGTLTSLAALTREDVAAFHAGRYSPAGAKLVFSGDITVDQARALAEQAFGGWRAATTAPEVVSRAGPASPPRVVVIDQPGAGQAAVFVARRSIARDDADYFPLTLGNTLLGGSFTSRLNQEIRIKRGLSYGTRSGLGVRLDTGAFTASAQTRNDAAVEVAGLILAELTRLATTRPTESEMTTRQAILTGAFGSSLETVDGLGSLVAGLALYDLPMSELAAYAGRVRAISAEQVQAAFAEHLPAADASLVIVGDASTFIEALRASYPNVEVIPLTGLNLDSATLR